MTAPRRLAELQPQRVAVFRALQLGDLLCAVPAMRALRAAVPEAAITLIGLPWAAEFVQRYPAYLDGFLPFPGHPAMPERSPDIAAFPRFLARAQHSQFDLAIQMHGSGAITNALLPLLGARTFAGYYEPDAYCPDPAWFLPFPADEPEVRMHLRLMDFLGAPHRGEYLEFPLTTDDYRQLHGIGAGLQPAGYVCVHAGAQLRSRRWPAGRFAAVADALGRMGFTIVLTGSPAEVALVSEVAACMRGPSINLAGQTTLGAMAALVQGARLVVGNDTGVSHLAAATSTPSVIIASGSDTARWAPLDAERHRVLSHDVQCRPCAFEQCPIGHPCALGVATEAVIEMATHQLDAFQDERTHAADVESDRIRVAARAVGTQPTSFRGDRL